MMEDMMDVGMEAGIFLAYAAGIALIFFFGKMLVIPARFMLKLLLNGVAGGALLVILNFFGGAIGITVPVNLITAFAAFGKILYAISFSSGTKNR